MSDFYKGIDEAPPLNSQNWVKPGVYRIRVEGFRPATREHDKEKFQVIDYRIEEVLTDRGDDTHSKGESVTHMMNVRHKKTFSRIRQFLSAISGAPVSDITADRCGEIADNNDLIVGLEAIADAYNVTTEKGTPFTVVDYRPLPSAPLQEEVPF